MARGTNPLILFFMGIIFAGVGFAVVYYLGKDINLICNRSVDKCVIEETNFLGNTEVKEFFALRKLAGAEVIETCDSEGDYLYKVMLITSDGRIPLSNMSSSDRSSHSKNVRKINRYVNSSDNLLEIEQSGNIIRIIGFVFAGIGILLLLGTLGGLLKLLLLIFVLSSKKR